MTDIATLYGNRNGLNPGDPTFVGHNDTLKDLIRRVAVPGNLQSAAIMGPRRIGKTSLLKQLLQEEMRAQFNQSAARWRVAYLDTSRKPWQNFDEFKNRMLRQMARAAEIRLDSLDSDDCFADNVDEICQRIGRPFVLLIDEFDLVGPQLGKTEQAEIRGALANQEDFAIVVAVTRPPDKLLEYIGEVVSDLAPLLNIAQPSLGALSEEQARSLFQLGRTLHELPPDPDGAARLTGWVGRHPLLLQAACYGWYRTVEDRAWGQLTEADAEAARRAVADEIGPQLLSVVRELSTEAKIAIEHGWNELTNEGALSAEADLRHVGLLASASREYAGNLLPAILRGLPSSDVRRRSTQELLDSEEYRDDLLRLLVDAIKTLNLKHQLLLGQRIYIIREDSLQDAVELQRKVKNDQDVKKFVIGLARLLYDGSDGNVSPAERGKRKPKLPGACYRDARSVVTHIICARNFFIHLPSQDDQVASKHLQDAAAVFRMYSGKPYFDGPEDCERFRVKLLTASIDFVKRLAALAPLEADLDAERIFGVSVAREA